MKTIDELRIAVMIAEERLTARVDDGDKEELGKTTRSAANHREEAGNHEAVSENPQTRMLGVEKKTKRKKEDIRESLLFNPQHTSLRVLRHCFVVAGFSLVLLPRSGCRWEGAKVAREGTGKIRS